MFSPRYEQYKAEKDENVLRELVYKASSQVLNGKAKSETVVGFFENLAVSFHYFHLFIFELES